MNTQIQPSTGMSSADYAAAKDGLLYGERDDAIALAKQLNKYRQTQAHCAAVSQTRSGYWRVWAPGTAAIATLGSLNAETVQ